MAKPPLTPAQQRLREGMILFRGDTGEVIDDGEARTMGGRPETHIEPRKRRPISDEDDGVFDDGDDKTG